MSIKNWLKWTSFASDITGLGADLTEAETTADVGAAMTNFGSNVLATSMADDIYGRTHSSIGYVAKNAAQGDGLQALTNTFQANWFTSLVGLSCCHNHHPRPVKKCRCCRPKPFRLWHG